MYENIKQMIQGAGRYMSISRYTTILYWIKDAIITGLITDIQREELMKMLNEC